MNTFIFECAKDSLRYLVTFHIRVHLSGFY